MFFYRIIKSLHFNHLDTLLNKCGINFPLLAYKELTGEDIRIQDGNYDTSIAFRYMFEGIFAIKDYINAKQLNRMQVLKSLLSKKAPAIWSFDDPVPAFSYKERNKQDIWYKKRISGADILFFIPNMP